MVFNSCRWLLRVMRHIVRGSSATVIAVVVTHLLPYAFNVFLCYTINNNWTDRIWAQTLTRVSSKHKTHTHTLMHMANTQATNTCAYIEWGALKDNTVLSLHHINKTFGFVGKRYSGLACKLIQAIWYASYSRRKVWHQRHTKLSIYNTS